MKNKLRRIKKSNVNLQEGLFFPTNYIKFGKRKIAAIERPDPKRAQTMKGRLTGFLRGSRKIVCRLVKAKPREGW